MNKKQRTITKKLLDVLRDYCSHYYFDMDGYVYTSDDSNKLFTVSPINITVKYDNKIANIRHYINNISDSTDVNDVLYQYHNCLDTIITKIWDQVDVSKPSCDLLTIHSQVAFTKLAMEIKKHYYAHGGLKITDDKLKITDVIFNGPATIVFWNDGTKTVVQSCGEKMDPEKGLAMAISKKFLGNSGSYYNEFKKWIPVNDKDLFLDIDDKVNQIKYLLNILSIQLQLSGNDKTNLDLDEALKNIKECLDNISRVIPNSSRLDTGVTLIDYIRKYTKPNTKILLVRKENNLHYTGLSNSSGEMYGLSQDVLLSSGWQHKYKNWYVNEVVVNDRGVHRIVIKSDNN